MQKFKKFIGLVVPLDRANIDTDAIIPKQFLKSIKRTGFGVNLFDSWRYLDPGEPGMDPGTRKPNPEFVLNKAIYHGAEILLTRENFGCGSSREHAPWAILDFGLRVVIAPSFGEIFFNNSVKNGLLPIVMPATKVDQLFRETMATPGYKLTIDLERQMVTTPIGETIQFVVDPFHKHCLLNGLDEIGLSLQYVKEITAFEKERRQQQPWLFNL